MRFEGQVFEDDGFWLVEVPALHAMTQGTTREEALEMIRDLIETMADEPGFEAQVYERSEGEFELGANVARTLVALLLRRQREKEGLTLADAAARLRQKSRNAYARYEQGQVMPTVEKLEELLRAVAPNQSVVWRFSPSSS